MGLFAERSFQFRHDARRVMSLREREDAIISDKLKEVAFLDSASFHRKSREKQKVLVEVAHTLPLEVFR